MTTLRDGIGVSHLAHFIVTTDAALIPVRLNLSDMRKDATVNLEAIGDTQDLEFSRVRLWGAKTPFTLLDQPGLQAEPRFLTTHSHSTDPTPKAVQYMASVLDSIGLKASVKTLDESVYWDTIATQKGDPQIAFNDWNQDFPEGQDFIDVLLNGEHISAVGNNNQSNMNIAAYNGLIDKARRMPLGK